MAEVPYRREALKNGHEPQSSSDADLNMRILQSLIWFVIDNFGEDKLNSICFEAGLSAEHLKHCRGWISLEQTEIVLKLVRELVGSEEAFMEACVYRMKESYGPLRFLLWASSPIQMLEMGQRHFSTISTFSRGDFSRITDSRFRLRYHSTRKESRLMCLPGRLSPRPCRNSGICRELPSGKPHVSAMAMTSVSTNYPFMRKADFSPSL